MLPDNPTISGLKMASFDSGSEFDVQKYEALYKHFHAHPELSNLEKDTAKTVAEHLSHLDAFEITTNIGGHGVVGVLRNGAGNTIMLRADMDGLPVLET